MDRGRGNAEEISGQVSLSGTQQYRFYSDIADRAYKLFIAKPMVPVSPGDGCAVLYLLDANMVFMSVTEITRLLQFSGELPPVFVVGIGYMEDDWQQVCNRRLQEFTPTANPDLKELWSLTANGGEAHLFLRFVQEELKPFIEASYPVNSNDAALAGASLGGLFALYTLFHTPAAFNKYIIGSPAVYWDNGVLWDYEKAFSQQSHYIDAKIFMGVGGEEDAELKNLPEAHRDKFSHVSMINDMQKMAETLKGYGGLELQSHVFENETHMSVVMPWLSHGLRKLYSPAKQIARTG